VAKDDSSFTDLYIKGKKPRDARYTVYEKDARYEGFVLDVMPSGKKSFRYRYRIRGKREKVTIGSYPSMSLATARERYREMRELVHRGISPAKEKKLAAKGVSSSSTFAQLAEDWTKNALRVVNKNARQDETYLQRDILPIIGSKELSEVQRSDLWTCIDNVRARGHGQAARRVQSVLKRVFAYGFSAGVVTINPAMGIDPRHVAPTRTRDRVLSLDEIPVWLHTIETSSISRSIKLALRLLMLIPARKGELLAARWSDVDLGQGTWDIPKENSKNGIPIRHRLTSQALGVFKELQPLAIGSEWVLPSTRHSGRVPMSKSGINTALRGVKGLPAGVVIHDLRRTIRTYLAELGVSTQVAELCLNHRPTGVKKVYDRAELIEQRYLALSKWENYLHLLLESPKAKPAVPANSELEAMITQVLGDEQLRQLVLQRLLTASS
jgi:integrase